MALDESRSGGCACGADWHPPLDAVLPTAVRRVRERVDALHAGEGGVLVVRGDHDAGTGWLVAAARDLHGGPFRAGRASPARRRVPLWPLWETVAGDGGEPRPRPGIDAVNRVVSEIAAVAVDGPVLVAIEEIEHADSWTLAGLEALAEAAADGPLLVVITVGSSGLTPADELADLLLERDLARGIDVGPLPRHELALVVGGALGTDDPPDELVAFVADRASGLLGLAVRMVRTAVRRRVVAHAGGRWRVVGDLERAVPDDAASSARRALASTSAIERDLLTAAAVLGGPLPPRALAEAVGRDLDDTADALARSSLRGLLRLGTETVTLRTGIVREEVLRTMPLRTSPVILDRIADASSRHGDGAGFERVLEILVADGNGAGVAGHRLRMARRAVDDGDLTTARRQLDALPASAERSRIELDIAAAAGAPRDGERPDTSSDDERVAWTRAVALRDVAEASAVAGDAPSPWRTMLDALTVPLIDRADAVAAVVDDLGPATTTALRHLAALALSADDSSAGALLRRAGSVASASGDAIEGRRVTAAGAQLDLVRTASPHRLVTTASELLRRGDRVVGAAFAADAALALVWSGDPARGQQLAAAAVDASIDRAPETARRARAAIAAAAAAQGGEVTGSGSPAAATAFAALTGDDLAAALGAIAIDEPDDPAFPSVASTQWAWVAHTAPLLRRLVGEPIDPVPDRWGWSANVAAWDDLARAAELGAAGDVAAAQTAFTNADALLARSPLIRLLARRLAGELAVGDGWAGLAVERALRAALAESVQRDLAPLASRCRAVLRAGGFAVPRFSDGDDDVPVDLRATGVTARELEIVRLLQDGASTAEVAERLYVSVATVKSHVTHVMRKLGYRSRRELLAGVSAHQT